MTRSLTIGVLLYGAVLTTAPAGAQAPAVPPVLTPPATPPATLPTPGTTPARGQRGTRTSLDVQITVVRSLGGKVISRLPHTLTVVTFAPASVLNMGAEVPVPSTTITPVRPAAPRPAGSTPSAGGQPGQPAPAPPEPAGTPQPIQSVTYRTVGTVISCAATAEDNGSYELTLSVDDSSVLPRDAADAAHVAPGLPAFRSFRTRNTLLMRDAQSRTFTVAADRVSGEEVQVEVKLAVLK